MMNSHARQKKDMADMLAAMEQEFADAENELRQVRRAPSLGWAGRAGGSLGTPCAWPEEAGGRPPLIFAECAGELLGATHGGAGRLPSPATQRAQEFEAQREEIKNRNSEDYNVLKIQLEGIIEELERHFEQVRVAARAPARLSSAPGATARHGMAAQQPRPRHPGTPSRNACGAPQAHKAYLETTEHRTSAFKQLTRNDAQAARVIEKRMRKLVKLQQALMHWRTKIATNSRCFAPMGVAPVSPTTVRGVARTPRPDAARDACRCCCRRRAAGSGRSATARCATKRRLCHATTRTSSRAWTTSAQRRCALQGRLPLSARQGAWAWPPSLVCSTSAAAALPALLAVVALARPSSVRSVVRPPPTWRWAGQAQHTRDYACAAGQLNWGQQCELRTTCVLVRPARPCRRSGSRR